MNGENVIILYYYDFHNIKFQDFIQYNIELYENYHSFT